MLPLYSVSVYIEGRRGFFTTSHILHPILATSRLVEALSHDIIEKNLLPVSLSQGQELSSGRVVPSNASPRDQIMWGIFLRASVWWEIVSSDYRTLSLMCDMTLSLDQASFWEEIISESLKSIFFSALPKVFRKNGSPSNYFSKYENFMWGECKICIWIQNAGNCLPQHAPGRPYIHILVLQIGGPAESQSHWVVISNSGAYKHTDLQGQLEIHREHTHVSCMTVPAESLSWESWNLPDVCIWNIPLRHQSDYCVRAKASAVCEISFYHTGGGISRKSNWFKLGKVEFSHFVGRVAVEMDGP